ncbi:MAG: DUF669 domain-containing protein [Vampirovibrionales bacterium]|jgi:hypothetical protein|nr:DUF669 domain-containing protein [Vampirovibrionales bacterium]
MTLSSYDLSYLNQAYEQAPGLDSLQIPPGSYVGHVEKAEFVLSQNGNSQMFTLHIKIMEGELYGLTHTENIILAQKSEQSGMFEARKGNLNQLKFFAKLLDPAYGEIALHDLVNILPEALNQAVVFFNLEASTGKNGKTYINFKPTLVNAHVAQHAPPPLAPPAQYPAVAPIQQAPIQQAPQAPPVLQLAPLSAPVQQAPPLTPAPVGAVAPWQAQPV